ncbi:SDR family oxidoreductase [Lactobacillus sp. DCY120]|uniref:SDR family oxidoreductase n=1 Tax=Bombilactobacillus apium TaxID=2675299 RepID=A0A850R572_9LACO|nr:SDR family oxidoreductase [Bombilactobacillus apium]NVY95742.1 SDR family oxidoreductase [Bombilactobacillus apium]
MQIAALKHLQGQNIMITGASSGIGRQLALQLAYHQANLILIARHEEALKKLQRQCQALTAGQVVIYPLDVGIAKHVQTTCAAVLKQFPQIGILINAAGFGDFDNFLKTDYALWHRMFKVNVLGTMLMTRLIASTMVEQGQGHIINIGSMGGKIPTPKSAVYSATKAAVIAFSDALRLELKPLNVQVTTVNPGPVATNFFKTADHNGRYLQSVGAIILPVEEVAQKIIAKIGLPVREINLPKLMAAGYVLYQLCPYLGDFVTQRLGNKK